MKWEQSLRRGAHTENSERPLRPKGAACNTSYALIASDKNDLRCATGTCGLLAQTKRKPSANQRANQAQIIFPRTSVIFEMRRKPFCPLAQIILPAAQTHFARSRKSFCQLRKSFGPDAQVVLLRALACPRRNYQAAKAISAGMETDSQESGWLY